MKIDNEFIRHFKHHYRNTCFRNSFASIC